MSSQKLEVFTDYVCPWCYLGDSRIKKLINIFDIDIKIIHFPLHPDTPIEGKPLIEVSLIPEKEIKKLNPIFRIFSALKYLIFGTSLDEKL